MAVIEIPNAEILKIAAQSYCSPTTVRRAYKGETLTHASWARVTEAAQLLGLDAPPARTAKKRRTK